MNHLAHLLLAGDDPDEVVGALMGDYVRGHVGGRFRSGIRLGVLLHRKVDVYTDAHPRTLLSRRRIRPDLRRYAGLVTDLAYDHYLSRHWRRFSPESFDAFSRRVYAALEIGRAAMPSPLRERLPAMIEDRFLRRSFEIDDLRWALQRLSARLRRSPDLQPAIDDLLASDAAFEADFLAFFPDLQAHVADQRERLRHVPG